MDKLTLTKKYDTYPRYKDSGVEWLGNVPQEWGVGALRSVLMERKEKNKNLVTDNILSVMKDIGVIRYADKGDIGNKSSDRPENYKVVYPGDIVANSMNLVIGSVGQAKELGVTSSVYIIYYPRNKDFSAEFYSYIFRSKSFQKYVARFGKGIMELRESIKPIDLKTQLLPVPDREVQDRIVSYLDDKTALIDSVIEKKKKQIELLREKRAAFVDHILASVEGETGKLKNYAVVNPSKGSIVADPDSAVSFVPMEALSETGVLTLREKKFSEVKNGFTHFRENDVVIAKITPCFENGKAGVMRGLLNGFGFGTTEFIVLRPSEKILSDYLYYIVFSDKFRKLGEVGMKGSAGQKRVTNSFVANYEIKVPNLEEQKRIVSEIETKTKVIDSAITKVETTIEFLAEFKSSLISHAVTGKIRI